MKARILLIGLSALGCRSTPAVLEPPGRTKVSVSSLNGKLDRMAFRWDLGGRPVREVRAPGMRLQGNPRGSQSRPAELTVDFSAASKGRAKLHLELRQVDGGSSTTTGVTSEVSMDGGLESIDRNPEIEIAPDGTVTLVRWKDRTAKSPTAVVVTFR